MARCVVADAAGSNCMHTHIHPRQWCRPCVDCRCCRKGPTVHGPTALVLCGRKQTSSKYCRNNAVGCPRLFGCTGFCYAKPLLWTRIQIGRCFCSHHSIQRTMVGLVSIQCCQCKGQWSMQMKKMRYSKNSNNNNSRRVTCCGFWCCGGRMTW